MKRWIIFAAVLALTTTSHAIMLSQGSRELAVEGLFDTHGPDGDQTDLVIFYGEFPEDNMEIGLQGRVHESERLTEWRVGVRVEMNFTQYEVVPYVALTLEYADVDVEPDDEAPVAPAAEGAAAPAAVPDEDDLNKQAAVVGGHVGLKWFISETIAISGAFVAEYSSEDMYPTDNGGLEHSDASLRLGMRFFF